MSNFEKVREYLVELDYAIHYESEIDGIFVVNHEENGIKNMMLGVAEPILIMEQFLFDLTSADSDILIALLQKNRDMVHGAFVLDESGKKVIFRDTLQLENLDLNEIEASFNALGLLLSEYTEELISFSKA
ncbi:MULTISPECIES: YbjN domain-containing protein [Persicobacter]|uniref:Molecular chaperone Tir n=1 Tax=Persicobacter diffluens TaxID=981 RepID=A0AAN5ALI7_9BACT|nr:YbjN domain-containing protein [Persicobacter sp. CCB-QB2]GJM60913.1 hypothetical protein PEDI_14650 [Persicobacter diffluens]